MMKKQEWTDRSAVRKDEIEALGAAVKILAKATGVRSEAPANPSFSFLQMDEDPRTKAINLLRATAHVTHSKALERLVGQLLATPGPFASISNMVEKLIFHLMDEQKDEDVHKVWCDQELSQSNITKNDKQDKLEELDERVKLEVATVQELTLAIESAQKAVSTLATEAEQITEIRQVGKQENEEALKDAQNAQAAIAEAIDVLQSFYKDSGMVKKESWELLQLRAGEPAELPAAPSTWGSSYTGVADPTNQPAGIISVLQSTASKFATMEAETRAQEETDQQKYDQIMKAGKILKAEKETEIEQKTAEKKRLVYEVDNMKKEVKHYSGELDAVVQYLKDLSPACVEGSSTYTERKAVREKEIQALKQAQGILAEASKNAGAASFVALPPPRMAQRKLLRVQPHVEMKP